MPYMDAMGIYLQMCQMREYACLKDSKEKCNSFASCQEIKAI